MFDENSKKEMQREIDYKNKFLRKGNITDRREEELRQYMSGNREHNNNTTLSYDNRGN
jgi:hypothetical protein